MLFARDGFSSVATAVVGAVWAESGEAQLSASGLRFVLPVCGGLPAEAGSRPGGRAPFLCRQERNQRSGPRFNAARFAHGPLRCSKHRVAAELALAALGAQTVLATAALRASEPDASALLGVSEGELGASTINCSLCRFAVRENGDGFEFGPRRERRVAERDRAEGRGLFELRAQRGRVPQAPGRASNAGESGTQCVTANGVSGVSRSTAPRRWSGQCVQTLHYFGSPFLGYFSWRSKRSNTPAGGGTPATERLIVTSGRHSRWASTNSALPTKTLARRNAHQHPNRHRMP